MILCTVPDDPQTDYIKYVEAFTKKLNSKFIFVLCFLGLVFKFIIDLPTAFGDKVPTVLYVWLILFALFIAVLVGIGVLLIEYYRKKK